MDIGRLILSAMQGQGGQGGAMPMGGAMQGGLLGMMGPGGAVGIGGAIPDLVMSYLDRPGKEHEPEPAYPDDLSMEGAQDAQGFAPPAPAPQPQMQFELDALLKQIFGAGPAANARMPRAPF